jgi:hypothetical protein
VLWSGADFGPVPTLVRYRLWCSAGSIITRLVVGVLKVCGDWVNVELVDWAEVSAAAPAPAHGLVR